MPIAYEVFKVTEGALGTLLLGSSGVPLKRLSAELNRWSVDGWALAFQVIESRRFMLFWHREAVIVTMQKPMAPISD